MASIKVRSDASRAERTVDESVGSFDGYLVLKSEDVRASMRASALHRFWTADDVQKFMRSGEIEAMIAEFVAEWWRTILLPKASSSRPFRRVAVRVAGWVVVADTRHVTEHNVLLVRSIIPGSFLGDPMSGGDSRALLRASGKRGSRCGFSLRGE